MICIAYIICADDVVETNAIAPPYIVRNKKNTKKRIEYGLYVICIACIICADDVVEKKAIALPYIVRNKKIQRNVRTCEFSSVACIRLYSVCDT